MFDVIGILRRLEDLIESEHSDFLDDFKHLVQMIAWLVDAAHDYRMCSLAGGHDGQHQEQRLQDMIATFSITNAQ